MQKASQHLSFTDENGSGKSILVAEDETEIRDLVSIALTQSGYRVTTAATTQEALAVLESKPVDAVVTDLMMPGGGGWRILQVRKEMHNPPPVLVITGRGDETVAQQLHAAGAAGYLSKPFSIRALLAALGAALEA